MAIQTINIGAVANDGTGDNIREAFQKINSNFEYLEINLGIDNTALNVGNTNGIGIFKQKEDGQFKFKKLLAGTGITLDNTTDPDTIEITSGIVGDLNVAADNGTTNVVLGTDTFTINGGTNITTTLVGDTLTIDSQATSLSQDTNPTLGGNLDLNNNDITGTGNINITGSVTASAFIGNLTGNVTGLVNGLDIRDIESELTSFDFGPLGGTYTRVIPYLLSQTVIDMGTFNNPSPTSIDGSPSGQAGF
jgi:hypothetical protein